MVLLPFDSLENYSNPIQLMCVRMKLSGRNKSVFKGQTKEVVKKIKTRVCRRV